MLSVQISLLSPAVIICPFSPTLFISSPSFYHTKVKQNQILYDVLMLEYNITISPSLSYKIAQLKWAKDLTFIVYGMGKT